MYLHVIAIHKSSVTVELSLLIRRFTFASKAVSYTVYKLMIYSYCLLLQKTMQHAANFAHVDRQNNAKWLISSGSYLLMMTSLLNFFRDHQKSTKSMKCSSWVIIKDEFLNPKMNTFIKIS